MLAEQTARCSSHKASQLSDCLGQLEEQTPIGLHSSHPLHAVQAQDATGDAAGSAKSAAGDVSGSAKSAGGDLTSGAKSAVGDAKGAAQGAGRQIDQATPDLSGVFDDIVGKVLFFEHRLLPL